ncbi:cation/H(+) antiporter 15-like [Tasmannia lanceolata]|uniref:cation/H(+) antiporter 15-like n=1 Tax=Tasmannia lanceolata TaxID=3420 RepID=UPI004062D509
MGVSMASRGAYTFLHFQSNISVLYQAECFRKTSVNSVGIHYGDNPLNHSVPLFCLQVFTIFIITLIVQFLLKPLRQPRIVSEILGAIIVGPSVLGRNERFSTMVFPRRGNYMLQTVASIGFIYYLFLSGVKQDMSMIKQTGRRSFVIAISGLLLTLVSVGFSSFSLGKPVMKNTHKSFFATLAISLSITNFPVTHPILAELNLLNSEVGRLALSASIITDFIAWTAFIFYQGNSQEGGIGHRKSMWYFSSIILLICFIIFVIRPVMRWIVKQTPKGKLVDKVYIGPILLLAMVMAFFSNMLGATLADGPLFMGMAVPDGPPLGATLVKNAETLNNSLFLSLFLTKAGLRVNLFKIASWKNWGIMQLIILSGYIGKLVGTVLACRCYRIPWKQSLSLGLIMNFRGVVEIITYDHWLRDQARHLYPFSFSLNLVLLATKDAFG